ncbi:hypothetical protein FRX94_02215 [Corynebacterium canis]|uniref:Uncharacterized protein n=1 Tax=Corynebacterium canis TaxID=679663 RepID=A0A5C5UT95_9CORY|nr:hypothetical protein [Corynebacterium canis]TWT28723.1 hypothetical protein FRX94_02215 [Corynebacterium canis]WJY75701.1 hypothetical protein CCANI_09365 [Corynebacterium canis]
MNLKSAAIMLLAVNACAFAIGAITHVLPPLGRSPEFALYALIVFSNMVLGLAVGAISARRLGIGPRGIVFALLCAASAASSLVVGLAHYPGAAALALGPVMAALAYWSAMVTES